MRGVFGGFKKKYADLGIIPAHAGSINTLGLTRSPFWDHPRSCGEYLFWRTLMISMGGSSPLMRGVFNPLPPPPELPGIIPAHAGSIRKRLRRNCLDRDHPRSCGEYLIQFFCCCRRKGSSPLMRGVSATTDDRANFQGIIPAHAGSMRCLPC